MPRTEHGSGHPRWVVEPTLLTSALSNWVALLIRLGQAAPVKPSLTDFPDLPAAFGEQLTEVGATSIYRWAPVFRCLAGGRPGVLKRTSSPLADGQAVAGWTRALRGSGIAVVAPLDLGTPNPVAVGEHV